MKKVTIIQHNSAEYLGLMEDHLEGRGVRFRYLRPFTGAVAIPPLEEVGDGLILLGGGVWGSGGVRDVPTLKEEVRLARACLMANKLIIGFGVGAQILALAAGGTVAVEDLTCRIGTAMRDGEDALGGYLPQSFPYGHYGRDRAVPPDYAKVLARDSDDGRLLAFQMGETAFGFEFHPGLKVAMVEDLVMEFEECAPDMANKLTQLRAVQRDIEDALVPFMTGLVGASQMMA